MESIKKNQCIAKKRGFKIGGIPATPTWSHEKNAEMRAIMLDKNKSTPT